MVFNFSLAAQWAGVHERRFYFEFADELTRFRFSLVQTPLGMW
jgi:hypothetical protein